jgi:hypothetical protein
MTPTGKIGRAARCATQRFHGSNRASNQTVVESCGSLSICRRITWDLPGDRSWRPPDEAKASPILPTVTPLRELRRRHTRKRSQEGVAW